jgi:hypothetical protein
LSDDKKVLIKYTNSSLVAQHGARPIEVTKEMGERYEQRGWAKILNSFPQSQVDLDPIEIDELKAKYEKDSVKYNFEDKWLDKIGWVTSGQIPLSHRKYGDGCGFIISQTSPINFSPGKLCLNDLIILSSNLSGFSDIQILKLSVVLYQRGIPFCFRVEDHLVRSEQVMHYLMRAKVVFCAHEDFVAEALDMLGEGVEDRLFIESTDAEFWKKINEVGKK